MYSIWIIISIAFEAFIYVFHISVLIVIFARLKKKFNEAFYQLLVIIFIQDFLYYVVVTCIGNRMLLNVRNIAILESNPWLLKVILLFGSITTTSQYFGHTLIAANRFTSLWDNIYHQKIWSKNWYLPFMLLFPLLPCFLFIDTKTYIVKTSNEYIDVGIVSRTQAHLFVLLNLVIMLSCTILSALFNLLAVWFWNKRKHSLNFQQNKQSEFGLLGIAITLFIVQAIRCGHAIALNSSIHNPEAKRTIFFLIPLAADLFAWVGSASVVILNKTIRRHYIEFYFCTCVKLGITSN